MSSARDKPELLNSSFYSSNSINTLDHAKTFRNSLILNVLSDNSIANSIENEGMEDLNGTDATFVEDNESDQAVKRDEYSLASTIKNENSLGKEKPKKNETQTINMSTSPSLSALANILQEKSKTADQKMRNSMLINITEEGEEQGTEEIGETQVSQRDTDSNTYSNLVASPNLIDIDGTNNVKYSTFDNNNDSQPDFLTTPKVEQGQNTQKLNFVSSLNAIVESQEKDIEEPRVDNKQTEIPTPKPSEIPKAEQYDEPVTTVPNIFNNNHNIKTNLRSISENQLRHTYNDAQDSNEIATNIFNKPLQNNSSTTSLPQGYSNNVQPIKRSVTNEQIKSNILRKGPKMDPATRASRTVSTGPVLEQTSQYKEKKGFFSFLKKKNKNTSKKNIPTSTDNYKPSSKFNSTSSKNSAPEIPKKSHSSNNIFGNFKKKKSDIKTSVIHDNAVESSNQDTLEKLNIPKGRSNSNTNVPTPFANIVEPNNGNDIRNRKPTPLNFDSPLVVDTAKTEDDHFIDDDNDKNYILGSPDVGSPAFSLPKPDAGEALFPKFLNSLEVDSIVSLERTRSIKSNKRNSINSHRRSLTDTLSINAQNEGMFITEVGSAVLSTPDLTKSPASSILRSGRFEAPFDMEISTDIDDSEDMINDRNNIDEMINEENETEDKNAFSMKNMENEFEQILSVDDRTSNSVKIAEAEVNGANQIYEEDQELMSDIMDFANIIDFGEEMDLGLGLSLNNDNSFQTPNDVSSNTQTTGPKQEGSIPKIIMNENISPEGSPVKMSDQEENEEVFKYEIRQEKIEPALPSPPLSEKGKIRISFDANSFENENFNEIEDSQYFTEDDLMGIDNDGNLMEKNDALMEHSFTSKSPLSTTLFFEEEEPETSNSQVKLSVSFSTEILLFETYGEEDYDRRPEIATCNQLTPQLAQMIKAELNELKSEMTIHEDSRCYTHYY